MARKPKSDTDNHDEKIRSRAYELWEEEGRPDGRHDEHWSQASSEVGLAGKKGVAQPKGATNGDAADDVVAEVPVVKRNRAAGSGSQASGSSATRGARKNG